MSRHLALLLGAGMVTARRQGRQTWYAIDAQGLAPVLAWLDQITAPRGGPPLDEVTLTGLDLEVRRTRARLRVRPDPPARHQLAHGDRPGRRIRPGDPPDTTYTTTEASA